MKFVCRWIAAAVLLSASIASGQVTTEITRLRDDGVVVPIVGSGGVFEIGEGMGERAGVNLFHSFETFDLAAGDTALFTADPDLTTENVVSRVFGGEVSQIFGTLQSLIGEQRFIFLNPAGIAFGPDSRLDVSGAFFASTADELVFEDGKIFPAGESESVLTAADPQAFGFLGNGTGAIDVEGVLETAAGMRLGLIGGDLTQSGAALAARGSGPLSTVSAPDADVVLVSVGSEGTVSGVFEAGGAPVLEGFGELGRIEIVDEAIVNTSGVSPTQDISNLDPLEVDPFFGELIFAPFEEVLFGDILLGDLVVGGTTLTAYLRPRRLDGAGNLFVRGRDLLVRDSDMRSVTAGADGGAIDVELSGDLTIERVNSPFDTGLLARTGGIPFGGTVEVIVNDVTELFPFEGMLVGDGRGGAISVRASNVTLLGGGIMAASSLSRGPGGPVTVVARDSVDISGRGPRGASGIFSNAQGTEAAGSILVEADALTLSDGGGIFAQTTFDGAAGSIGVDVADLVILDDSQIDSSTSGNLIDQERSGKLLAGLAGSGAQTNDVFLVEVDGVPILRRPTERVVNADPTASDLVGPTRGTGGNVVVTATDSAFLSGRIDEDDFARLSTFAQERTAGTAGKVEVTTPRLEIADGAGIAVTTSGAGDGGEIQLDVGRLLLRNGGSLSAQSTGTAEALGGRAPGAAGDIEIEGDRITLERGSISAFAVEGPEAGMEREGNITIDATGAVILERGTITASVGTGLGGNIRIERPTGTILGDASQILAQTDTGTGGAIEIITDAFLASEDSVVSADAGVGTSGTVSVSAPTTNIVAGITPLEAKFQDASALLRSSCATAAASGGSFHVGSRHGMPASPEGYLLASGDVGLGEPDLALEGSETPPPDGSGAGTDDMYAYENAARRAAEAGRADRQALGLSKAARAALEAGRTSYAGTLLVRAEEVGRTLPASRARVYLEIHLARTHALLAESQPGREAEHLLAANAALLRAVDLAEGLDDARAASYAFGNLGSLYASRHRFDEALFATQRALSEGEEANDPDALYRWHRQSGRFFWAQGRAQEALESYRRAVEILEETRQEALARYADSDASFRLRVAPVYLEFVSALLESSARVSNPQETELLLTSARAVMERFRAAELRDYFRDECVAAPTPLERVAPGGVAVVYPIVLADRLELLVSLPAGIGRYTAEIPAQQLAAVVDSFRDGLLDKVRNTWREPSQSLYDWLVRPYEHDLVEQGVGTLVFVPGGALRTIPMAALHDGEKFLIERYALAVTPGLSLIEPVPLDPDEATLLLAGLSEATSVEVGGKTLRFAALPNVPKELSAIQALYGGDKLLDEQFEADRFEATVSRQSPSMVHLASHALFTGDPKTTFLLTYDDKLTLDRMAQVVRPAQFREQPLELLVLSACETAAGDERAALGLAGVAVQAGARSVVGSLWSLSDESAYELMVTFYGALRDPQVSKAQALRRAQLALLREVRFSHPFYWSPYLLISNWL